MVLAQARLWLRRCATNNWNTYLRLGIGLIIPVVFFRWIFFYSQTLNKEGHAPSHYIPKFSTGSFLQIHTKRIVILAGPGKTSSSSVQFNLQKWSEEGLLGKAWKWITPNRTCVCLYDKHCRPEKFKAWYSLGTCFEEVVRNRTANCTKLQSCYQDELNHALVEKKGVSVVFGTERIVNSILMLKVLGSDPQSAAKYFQSYMDLLPPMIKLDEVLLVVTYRAPKIDHLVSQWKQIRDMQDATLPLRAYLHSDHFFFYALDPLYVTKIIADDYGLDVILLDSSGISLKGYDISNVIACQILGVPCHLNNMTLRNEKKAVLPAIINARKDDPFLNDLTDKEKSKIESILRKLDCNSIHSMFAHPRIQLLQPHQLIETRNLCGKEVNRTFYSHKQAKQDIRFAVMSQ